MRVPSRSTQSGTVCRSWSDGSSTLELSALFTGGQDHIVAVPEHVGVLFIPDTKTNVPEPIHDCFSIAVSRNLPCQQHVVQCIHPPPHASAGIDIFEQNPLDSGFAHSFEKRPLLIPGRMMEDIDH